MRYLLDTNIVSAIARHEPAAMSRLAHAQITYLSGIVLGELYFGVYKIAASQRGRLLRAQYDTLATQLGVLDCGRATADYYARVRGEMDLKGQQIPENDMWIAALALQHGLTLATLDGHFQRVTSLPVDLW